MLRFILSLGTSKAHSFILSKYALSSCYVPSTGARQENRFNHKTQTQSLPLTIPPKGEKTWRLSLSPRAVLLTRDWAQFLIKFGGSG